MANCAISGSSVIILTGISVFAAAGFALNLITFMYFLRRGSTSLVNKMFIALSVTDASVCIFYPLHITLSDILKCRYYYVYTCQYNYNILMFIAYAIPLTFMCLSQAYTTTISVIRFLSIKFPLQPIKKVRVFIIVIVITITNLSCATILQNCVLRHYYRVIMSVVFPMNLFLSTITGVLAYRIMRHRHSSCLTGLCGSQHPDHPVVMNRIWASETILILVCVYVSTNLVAFISIVLPLFTQRFKEQLVISKTFYLLNSCINPVVLITRKKMMKQYVSNLLT